MRTQSGIFNVGLCEHDPRHQPAAHGIEYDRREGETDSKPGKRTGRCFEHDARTKGSKARVQMRASLIDRVNGEVIFHKLRRCRTCTQPSTGRSGPDARFEADTLRISEYSVPGATSCRLPDFYPKEPRQAPRSDSRLSLTRLLFILHFPRIAILQPQRNLMSHSLKPNTPTLHPPTAPDIPSQ